MSEPTSSSARFHPWLLRWRLKDHERAISNLLAIERRASALPLPALLEALSAYLPGSADPDMALNNLERFLGTDIGLEALPRLLDAGTGLLDILLQLFSTSQFLSDLLIAEPALLPMLEFPLRASPTRSELLLELNSAVQATHDDAGLLKVLRDFRHRHLLRIGTNDIVRDRPLEEITLDISLVAEVAVETALQAAHAKIAKRHGEPRHADGGPATCCVFAFGKLGGAELNYSSDIDLMILFSQEGQTTGKSPLSLGEFYGKVTTEMVRLLTAYPPAYRVDLRLRPEGHQGPLAMTVAAARAYYETMGRTWERQALLKLRPIAGDLELGRRFLVEMEPFVYRKYLGFAEINEIKVLKRKIEQRTTRAGEDEVEVKTGRGGIRDVEFTIQFLQLLHGGLAEVRSRATLPALAVLTEAGCLNDQEGRLLDDGYRFLRKVEHRLQLLCDLQTHRLPAAPEERMKLALRMGYPAIPEMALMKFENDYREKTAVNRRILEHLLHETFAGEASQGEPESDLILSPEPDGETIRAALGKYGFRDLQLAYRNLLLLAKESVPFLHNRRCRLFLANIAPALLRAVAETPDPDQALTMLEKVSASLGAKGVLWELFSSHPPSLKLYVDLCAGSPFLANLLIANPGMIDELLDSLVLNQPREKAELIWQLEELIRNADDPDRIIHSFRDSELLRIGTADLLGKESLPATLAALADLAEAILGVVVRLELRRLEKRWGPLPCPFVLLALGKLGGRELSYSSDLDLVLIYGADVQTAGGTAGSTSSFHFFSELCQRLINRLGKHGPYGRLYEVDMRLRPEGRSGALPVPLAKLREMCQPPGLEVWERQTLTRARVVYGDEGLGQEVSAVLAEAVYGPGWRPEMADDILSMRARLQASRGERDLKRGIGGIVDVEFLVQLLLLRHGREHPAIRQANVHRATEELAAAGLIPEETAWDLLSSYDFLRRVESRLRIVDLLAKDELPRDHRQIEQLARRLGYEHTPDQPAPQRFLADLKVHTSRARELFNALASAERNQG